MSDQLYYTFLMRLSVKKLEINPRNQIICRILSSNSINRLSWMTQTCVLLIKVVHRFRLFAASSEETNWIVKHQKVI